LRIQDATWALVDTETSGVEKGDDLLEVAVHLYHGIEPGERFTTLVKPTKPIPPESSGIHGLVDDMFDDAPERYEVMLALAEFIPEDAIVVAHNAQFDLGVLEWDRPHLCSERMAHHLTPEAPNFKLATLRYFYGFHHLDVGAAHRADADLVTTAAVFFHLVARYRAWAEEVCAGDVDRLAKAEEVETMIAWAKRPYIMARPAFGKHKTWDALLGDTGYTAWMLKLPDLSPEMRWNIEREQKLRRA
jgi:exodeoxyribonuclease X